MNDKVSSGETNEHSDKPPSAVPKPIHRLTGRFWQCIEKYPVYGSRRNPLCGRRLSILLHNRV